MSECLEAARGYAAAGLPCFAVDKRKRPLTKNGCKDATTDLERLETMWAAHPDAQVAIATGDGIAVLDIDGAEGQLALETLRREYDIPETLTARTPTDGLHLYYADPKREVRNSASKLAPGIDTRGQGGYVVAPPSQCYRKDTGELGAYEWASDDAPEDWPDDLTKALAEASSAKTINPPKSGGPKTREYALATLRGCCDEIESAGEGARNETLNGTAYRLKSLIHDGLLTYDEAVNGLYSAAIKAGLEERETDATIRSGLNGAAGNGTIPAAEPSNFGAKGAPKLQWERPRPIEVQGEKPEFPIEVLPEPFLSFSQALAANVQISPTVPAMGCMAAVAAMVQGLIKLDVINGYEEELCLYAMCILPPGSRKTGAIRPVAKPIREFQKELNKETEARRHEYLAKIAIKEKKKAAYQSEFSTTKKIRNMDPDFEDTTQETISNLSAEIAELQEEMPKKELLLLDDVTQEAVHEHLADHGRAAWLVDEMGPMAAVLGRYTEKGKEGTGLDVFLHGWSGSSLSVKRKNKDDLEIDRACLTMFLCCQPAAHAAFMRGSGVDGRGLSDRFLMCWPDAPEKMLGASKVPNVSDLLKKQYKDALWRLVGTEPGTVLLFMEDAAKLLADDFYEEIQEDMGKYYGWKKEKLNKIHGQACRLAGLLTIMAGEDIVTMKRARDAERLVRFFLASETRHYQDEAVRRARDAMQWLLDEGPGCRWGDLKRKGPREFRVPGVAAMSLSFLESLGWIRRGEIGEVLINPYA